MSKGPLHGLKVLDFTHVLAGPFATRILGDMGADVVKINSASRALAANDPAHPYYLMWNRNKRALALDMADPETRPLCRALCEQADIVIDNFSVGVLDRWGVGFAEVSETNPGVIYVQMSGMGDGGPWSKFVTYAPTIHALSGLTYLTGVPGRQDIGLGFSYNDHQAGLHGAVAILAALAARTRTGRGQRVDVSQFEVGVNFAGPALLDYFANGVEAQPTGNRPPYDCVAPHNVYRCAPLDVASVAQERWVAIACMTDAHWASLVNVLERPAWALDNKYATAEGRYAQTAEIDERLAQWTATRAAHEVMRICQDAGVPAGVVQNGIDLAEQDPQLATSEFLFQVEEQHPRLGTTYIDRLPLHFSRTSCDTYTRVRDVGEDNAAVLADWLDLDDGEIQRAADQGLLQ